MGAHKTLPAMKTLPAHQLAGVHKRDDALFSTS